MDGHESYMIYMINQYSTKAQDYLTTNILTTNAGYAKNVSARYF